MTTMVKIASVLFVCAMSVCGECRGQADARRNDEIWLLVWKYPEYPEPGVDIESPSGLIAAVRASGVYYRASSEKDIGSKFVTGKLSSNKLREIRRMFDRKWFSALSEKCRYVALHVSTLRLEMSFGRNQTQFTECSVMDNTRLDNMLSYLWALPVEDSTPVDLKSEKMPTPSFGLDSSSTR